MYHLHHQTPIVQPSSSIHAIKDISPVLRVTVLLGASLRSGCLCTSFVSHTLSPPSFLSQTFFLSSNHSCLSSSWSRLSHPAACTPHGPVTSNDMFPFCMLAKASLQGQICFLPSLPKQKLHIIHLMPSVPCTQEEAPDERLWKGEKYLEPGTHTIHFVTMSSRAHQQNEQCIQKSITHLRSICHAHQPNSRLPSHPPVYKGMSEVTSTLYRPKAT